MSTPPYPPVIKGSSFLLAWRLAQRRVLLIGGGLVASGRLYYLLEADAHITLISPRKGLHPETEYRIDVSNKDDIEYLDRDYQGENDQVKVEDFDMVLTAIDNVELSKKVCELCRKSKIPVNVADVPPECDFYFGSQLRRGPLQIMVSTSGRGPKIAAMIRRNIESSLPDNIEDAIESVGKLRSELRKRAPGTGGELGRQRMEWMIGVCDEWSLDDLCLMDDTIRTKLLDQGWERDRKVLGPRDMGVRKGWGVIRWDAMRKECWWGLGLGVVGSLTIGAAIPLVGMWIRKRR